MTGSTGYRLRDGQDFLSPHDADVFVEWLQVSGEMKRCGHLSVKRLHTSSEHYYRPVCAEDCFIESEEGGYPAATFMRFVGCPQDCRRYVSARSHRFWNWWRRTRWHGRENVVGIAGYFKNLLGVPARADAPKTWSRTSGCGGSGDLRGVGPAAIMA